MLGCQLSKIAHTTVRLFAPDEDAPLIAGILSPQQKKNRRPFHKVRGGDQVLRCFASEE